MYSQHKGAGAAGGGTDPAASVFDPNSFYNLGRCLQEQQGQDEGDRYGRGGGGGDDNNNHLLSESAPLPPSHYHRGQNTSDSFMLCSIRPQDIPPSGHRPFYDSIEEMDPSRARCRSMNDSMFMRQQRSSAGGTLSPISHSPPFPCYAAARRLDLDFSASQIEGLVGGVLSSPTSSSAASYSASSFFNHPRISTDGAMDTQRNGGAVAVGRNVGLVNRLWGRVKAFFQGFVALLLGRGLDDENSPASKLSKEWCFILGLALGCACVVFLFPKAPHYTVPSMNYGGAETHHRGNNGIRGGLSGWLTSFGGGQGSSSSSGLLGSSSSVPPAPSPGFGLSSNRKSQQLMSKPVLSSPSPAPGPTNRSGEARPTNTGGFTALLEAFWAKHWTLEGGDMPDEMMDSGHTRTERFRLPSGQEIVITMVRLSTGIWQVVSHALCGILLALLRNLPFIPKHLKSKRWC